MTRRRGANVDHNSSEAVQVLGVSVLDGSRSVEVDDIFLGGIASLGLTTVACLGFTLSFACLRLPLDTCMHSLGGVRIPEAHNHGCESPSPRSSPLHSHGHLHVQHRWEGESLVHFDGYEVHHVNVEALEANEEVLR